MIFIKKPLIKKEKSLDISQNNEDMTQLLFIFGEKIVVILNLYLYKIRQCIYIILDF